MMLERTSPFGLVSDISVSRAHMGVYREFITDGDLKKEEEEISTCSAH